MTEHDLDDFSDLLNAAAELRGAAPPTTGAKALFFRAVQEYPIDAVAAGIQAHIQDPKRGQFPLMPADVIGHIGRMWAAMDGRPGIEEAWSTVSRAIRDESVTIVWCEEMAHAAGMARGLLMDGDEVAARMAFKEVYGGALEDARAARRPARWSASLGSDESGRAAVLQPHIDAGRLSAAQADLLLPAPKTTDQDWLRLTGPAAADSPARLEALARLRELRGQFTAPVVGPSAADIEREELAQKKRASAEAIAAYVQSRRDDDPAPMITGEQP